MWVYLLTQALADKDTALATQGEEAAVQVAKWKKKSVAAQATADDVQRKALELEQQMLATKTQADQPGMSSAQQVRAQPRL